MGNVQLSIMDLGKVEKKITKPIRLIEMFAGYGSQALALKYLGVPFEHHRISEWAIPSIRAYKDLHFPDDHHDHSKGKTVEEIKEYFKGRISNNYNNPISDKALLKMSEHTARKLYSDMVSSHNLGSICLVHASDLGITETDKYEYVLTYSFPCVPAGTMVKTDDGYVPIEQLKSGDAVETHMNRYRKILKTMSRTADHIVTVKAVGVPNLQITDEHPLYVYRDGEFAWVKAKELRITDMLAFNAENNVAPGVTIDADTMWMLGRYVAYGHINKHTYNSVNFAIGFGKEEEFLKLLPADVRHRIKRFAKKGCADYRIADPFIKSLCETFGTGATHKRIPMWVYGLPNDRKQAFFDGYYSGDGHTRWRNGHPQMMFSTVSHELALGMQRLVAELYGIVPSCSIRKDSRKFSFNDSYNLQFSVEKQVGQRKIGDKIIVQIKSISKEQKPIEVFNIEVDEDNSYTCENVIVHNCQDLSNAGKGAGMSRDSGTRSGMLWEVERILKECDELPQVLIMENVPKVIGQKNIKDFAEWLDTLESLGYGNYYQILNATDFKIPQHRRRCFMVSLLGENMYVFPEGRELELRLKDVLENNVDEKYYLSDRAVEGFIAHTERHRAMGHGFKFEPTTGGGYAKCIQTRAGSRPADNYIAELPERDRADDDDRLHEGGNVELCEDGRIRTTRSCGVGGGTIR